MTPRVWLIDHRLGLSMLNIKVKSGSEKDTTKMLQDSTTKPTFNRSYVANVAPKQRGENTVPMIFNGLFSHLYSQPIFA